MPHFLIRFEFDGTDYCGWQRQKNALSVSEIMFDCLLGILGEVTEFSGCSRTDSGVHAHGFCASFSSEKDISPAVLLRALNATLPRNISVFSSKIVAADFHARYSALSKEYTYRIFNSQVRSPFYEGRALQYSGKLDIEKMNAEASKMIGTYDFRSFMASGSKITDCTRTVYSACFERVSDKDVLFRISADGFLYNMVRITVGTLLEINEGRRDDISGIIDAKSRKACGRTAPAYGLYLEKVNYGKDIDD